MIGNSWEEVVEEAMEEAVDEVDCMEEDVV
jgi:hypothetical protein